MAGCLGIGGISFRRCRQPTRSRRNRQVFQTFLRIFFFAFGISVTCFDQAQEHEHTELHHEFNILTDGIVLFEDYYWLIMQDAFESEEYKVALIFGDYDNLAACKEFAAVLELRNGNRRYSCKPAPR
jgi:hypothetical protein